jgi:D-aspartate ligase
MRKSLPAIRSGAVIIEGHIQGLSNTRSLGEAGIPVYVVDKTNCIARYSKYCRKYFRCPDYNTDEFAEFLLNLAVSENINGWVLIPSNDHAVYTISKHKVRLEIYYKIITPGLDIIENIYDKSRLLKIARDINIPVPKTIYLRSPDDEQIKEINYPVLTKGKNGLSFYRAIGEKALLAETENELRNNLRKIQGMYNVDGTFTQELIPLNGNNNTVSFTAFCVDGEIKTYWMGEKIREHPVRFGTATFARSVYVEECYKQSGPLLRALNYTGVCEVEYLLDPRDNKYKLIEINARTWLWVGLAKVCGIDYAKMIYEFVNTKIIEYPTTYEKDKYWINPLTDFTFSLYSIFKNNIGINSYINSILFANIVNDLLIRTDIRPGIYYLINLYAFLRYR